MTVSLTYEWAGGQNSQENVGFVITDPEGNEHPYIIAKSQRKNIPDPVARAVFEELHDQAGAASGTVTVSIS